MSQFIFFVLGIFLCTLSYIPSLNVDQLHDVLNKCENNKGIKSIKVPVGEYRLVCNDGAQFNINR